MPGMQAPTRIEIKSLGDYLKVMTRRFIRRAFLGESSRPHGLSFERQCGISISSLSPRVQPMT